MFTSQRLGHYLKVSFSLFSSYITQMEEIVSTTFYATISSSLMIYQVTGGRPREQIGWFFQSSIVDNPIFEYEFEQILFIIINIAFLSSTLSPQLWATPSPSSFFSFQAWTLTYRTGLVKQKSLAVNCSQSAVEEGVALIAQVALSWLNVKKNCFCLATVL